MRTVIDVEVWSDVVCPWCYIGKRRFAKAVDEVRDDIEVNVVYRPYQLDPTAPAGAHTPVREAYAKKFGGPERAAQIIDHVTGIAADEGLEFRMDRALRANTLLAHRLLWLAEATGRQEALKERLLQAYFHDGLDVGDPDVLADCAEEAGLDRDRVRSFLDSDDGRDQVATLLEMAADAGITAVPTYVFSVRPPASDDGDEDDAGEPVRAWMVPGAQDPSTFVAVLRRVAEKAAERG